MFILNIVSQLVECDLEESVHFSLVLTYMLSIPDSVIQGMKNIRHILDVNIKVFKSQWNFELKMDNGFGGMR